MNSPTQARQLRSSAGRRGGGPGVPAPQPVPPDGARSDGQSPFRVGTGGLVVVIVPEQLRAACARRGWSLTDLARRAGISYPTLRSTLRGKSVRPRTAWKLARALAAGDTPAELDLLLHST
jgi:lambda repressor-like predicted transcriptional regulator